MCAKIYSISFGKVLHACMEKLQKTAKGRYFIIISSEMVRLASLKEGDRIDIRSGLELKPKRGDLILRKVL